MPLPEDMTKLERASVSDEVYATLLGLIVDGTLKPDERMRDKELAERLGVSRTPVREALKRLEDAGLVQTVASRWTRVSPVGLEEAEKLYPIVWSLEPLALSFARGRISASELEEMRNANFRLEQALNEADPVRASRADYDFHEVIVRSSENKELARILGSLKLKLRRIEVLYFGGTVTAKKSVGEHENILDALRNGDYARAAAAIEANYKQSVERAFEHVRSSRTDRSV